MTTFASLVTRSFQTDYIIFDTIAISIWLLILIHQKQGRAFLFSFIGLLLYYVVDFGIWFNLRKIRHVHSDIHPALMLLWVSATPGLMHPSFAILLLEGTFGKQKGKINRLIWFILFFSVQTIPAFASRAIKLREEPLAISRTMADSRYVMLLALTLSYAYLSWRNIEWRVLLQLFFFGFVIEGVFELALHLSGIRTGTFDVLLIDSLIEYNLGMPATFLLWRWTYKPHNRPFYSSYYPIKAMKDQWRGEWGVNPVMIVEKKNDTDVDIEAAVVPASGLGFEREGQVELQSAVAGDIDVANRRQ